MPRWLWAGSIPEGEIPLHWCHDDAIAGIWGEGSQVRIKTPAYDLPASKQGHREEVLFFILNIQLLNFVSQHAFGNAQFAGDTTDSTAVTLERIYDHIPFEQSDTRF